MVRSKGRIASSDSRIATLVAPFHLIDQIKLNVHPRVSPSDGPVRLRPGRVLLAITYLVNRAKAHPCAAPRAGARAALDARRTHVDGLLVRIPARTSFSAHLQRTRPITATAAAQMRVLLPQTLLTLRSPAALLPQRRALRKKQHTATARSRTLLLQPPESSWRNYSRSPHT